MYKPHLIHITLTHLLRRIQPHSIATRRLLVLSKIPPNPLRFDLHLKRTLSFTLSYRQGHPHPLHIT